VTGSETEEWVEGDAFDSKGFASRAC
jgi:hypothetical protein